MLSIVTFKWGTRYKPEHVSRLRSMLARNLTLAWEFVLVSDDPRDEAMSMAPGWPGSGALGPIPGGSRYVPLWTEMRGVKNCGVRLPAFHPKMHELLGPRFAWVDMDVVITGNVDHIFSRPEPFVGLAPPAPPMLLNGSLVMMDAGAFPHVLSEWSLPAYESGGVEWLRRGCAGGGASDEGWMGLQLEGRKGVATVGGRAGVDGVYYYRRHLMAGPGLRPDMLPKDARLVVFNGRCKPWEFDTRARSPWILDHYH